MTSSMHQPDLKCCKKVSCNFLIGAKSVVKKLFIDGREKHTS